MVFCTRFPSTRPEYQRPPRWYVTLSQNRLVHSPRDNWQSWTRGPVLRFAWAMRLRDNIPSACILLDICLWPCWTRFYCFGRWEEFSGIMEKTCRPARSCWFTYLDAGSAPVWCGHLDMPRIKFRLQNNVETVSSFTFLCRSDHT